MKTFTLLMCLLLGGQVSATHLLGGYIQAQSTAGSALTYEITVTIYTDGNAAVSSESSITLCFGDGSKQEVSRQSRRTTNDRSLSISTYRVTHTYAGPGTYTLTTALANRTTTRNITGPTEPGLLVLINSFSTTNSTNQTPTILLPETGFQAAINQRLIFPFRTTDTEGDSSSYSITRPLTNTTDNSCTSEPVSRYHYPNDLTRRGIFKLDNRTGNLTWDAPTQPGKYSVAITVSEYRSAILISKTQVEFFLVVTDQPGAPGIIPPYEPARESSLITALTDYADEGVTLTVFPNPVDDRLLVVVQTSNPAIVQMQLLSNDGRTVHQVPVSRLSRRHEQVVDTSSLAPGTYILRAQIGDRTLIRKVVKQ